MTALPRLYAVADATFGDPVEMAFELFRAGVRLVQVRNKAASTRVLLEQTRRIVAGAPPGARVIVNDRADVALLSGAAGLHLGQEDLPPASARKVVGERVLLGLSTHDEQEAKAALRQPIDYLAFGPIFPTTTKSDASPVVGIDRLRRVCQSVDLPVVAIGGIDRTNMADVIRAGAASVAVISDLIGAHGIRARAESFLANLRALDHV